MNITITQKGDFKKTTDMLNRITRAEYLRNLEKYGQEGVNALSSATPVDSGETANSWAYQVKQSRGSFSITWINKNIVNGVPIAIVLQYGHGTRNGGYVQGRDYINPAIQPIFDKIADKAWGEVTKL